MKKILTIIGTAILSLIITFIFAETISLYHFGTTPTFTTFTYLLFIFCFITYILLSLIYIISKKIKKEKIGIKKIISLILFFISLMLILGFVVILNLDRITYYPMGNSAPFYVFILVRCLEFLLPSIILIIVGIVLLLKNKKSDK